MSRSQQIQPETRRERRAQARLEPRQPRRTARRATRRPAWQSPLFLTTAGALLVGAMLVVFALPKPSSPAAELVVPPVGYPAEQLDGTALGRSDAPVVIQLYADFQCPACKLFVTTELHRLVDDFVTPGIVRIEAQDIAILGTGQPDESLELAAGAACAADQGRYWQFHDLVFWNQGRENKGDHSAAFLGRVADGAGIDRQAWDACFAGNDVRPPITSRTNVAMGQGVRSTPTLVVNGQPVVGVPSYDQLAGLIRSLASAAPSPGPTAAPSPAS